MPFKDDFDRESIQNALKGSDLSWRVVRLEDTEFVSERLQNIFNFSKSQSIRLYDVIKRNDPKLMELETKKRIESVRSNLYLNFLSKCMSVYVD